MVGFIDKGSDVALLKALKDNNTVDQTELQKAIDKSKLVQIDVTVQGKNGTFTRKQWKRAGDVKSTDKVVGEQKPPKDNKPVNTNSYNGKTLSEMRVLFNGKTAADVQEEKGRIFKEMGRPSGSGTESYKKFKGATFPLNQLINDTINNGTGRSTGDYSTLLKTSVVKSKAEDNVSAPKDNEPTKGKAGLKKEIESVIGAQTSSTPDKPTKQKSTYFKADQDTKAKVSEFSKKMSNDELLDCCKINSIKWTEHDHKGINTMRMKMALAQAIQEGKVSVDTKTSGKSDIPKASDANKNDDLDIDLSDYTQSTSEKQSGTNEGEAHNLIVGHIKSNGLKPTDENVKKAARKFATEHDKLAAKTQNKDEQKHAEEMTKVFDKLAGNTTITPIKFSPKSLNFRSSDDAGVSDMLNELNSFVSLSGLQNGQPGFGTIKAGKDVIGFGYNKYGPHLTWNGQNYTDPKELGKKFNS